jgi:ssRNA-specific RNase YbeY (16S rRNA maturation enzyme)
VLHLLGHDHINEEDKKAMRAQEEQIMEQMGLPRSDAKGWIDGQ